MITIEGKLGLILLTHLLIFSVNTLFDESCSKFLCRVYIHVGQGCPWVKEPTKTYKEPTVGRILTCLLLAVLFQP